MDEHEKRSEAEASQAAPYADFIHSIFYTDALVSCDFHPQLHDVRQEAMKLLNIVKSRPMNSRPYSILLYVQKKCRQTRDRFYCIRRLGFYKNLNSVTVILVQTSVQAFGVRGGLVGIVNLYSLDGP